MVVMPRLRTFRLSLSRDDSGVSCNAQGFFARAIPAFGKTRFLDRSAHRQAEHRADGLLSTSHRRFGEERRFGADSERVQSRRFRHGRNRGRANAISRSAGAWENGNNCRIEESRCGTSPQWFAQSLGRIGAPSNRYAAESGLVRACEWSAPASGRRGDVSG